MAKAAINGKGNLVLLGRGKPPHDVKTVAITQYVRDLILQGEKLERKDANRKRPNAPAKAKAPKAAKKAKGKKGKAAKKAAAAPVETAVEVATEVAPEAAPAPEAAASEPTAADVEGITGDLSGD